MKDDKQGYSENSTNTDGDTRSSPGTKDVLQALEEDVVPPPKSALYFAASPLKSPESNLYTALKRGTDKPQPANRKAHIYIGNIHLEKRQREMERLNDTSKTILSSLKIILVIYIFAFSSPSIVPSWHVMLKLLKKLKVKLTQIS
ncbi:uncharacterized protein ACOB8E_023214 isoform 1-T1 [Sarcophilus harrisii]